MDKPYQSLVAFKKTPKLEPSKEIEISLSIKLRNVARYDQKKAYFILDKGKYIIRVGNSSNNTNIFGYIELDEDIITEQLKNIDNNPDFEDYKPKIVLKDDLSIAQKIKLTKNDFILKTVEYHYDFKIPPEFEKLKDKELAKLYIGNYEDRKKQGFVFKETGITGITSRYVRGIKDYLKMVDGPAGLRIAKNMVIIFKLIIKFLNIFHYICINKLKWYNNTK